MKKQRTKSSFTELVQDDLKALSMRPGSVIKGRIMSIEKNWITVDTRLKTEGRLPVEQFKNKDGDLEVKIGDEIELLLETVENGYGQTQVSYEKAKYIRLWQQYEEMYKANKTVQGTIRHKVNGGFSVDLAGIRAFLPGSLIDMGNNMDPRVLENTHTEFKIIKVDKERYNLVVSHRAIGRARLEDERRAYHESLMTIGKVRGAVKAIVPRGVLINLGKGIGFLRNLDIAWEPVHDAADHLKVGEEREFKVIGYNAERNCMLLSLREMIDSPWDNLTDNYQVGQELESTIRHINDHGLLVEIAPGLVGLVHTSELNWERTSVNPSDYGKPGDTLQVKILSMEPAKRRLSLSHRFCLANPWQEYADEHQVGDTVEGTIKDMYDCGFFVSLTECIDGYVPPKQLDWNLLPHDAIKQFRKGQKVRCVLLNVDINNRRILLSVKKTKPNYYLEYNTVHPAKSIVMGKVKKIGKKNIIVELTDHVSGILPIRELSSDKMKLPEDLVKIDQELQLQVLHYDPKNKGITLSRRAVTEGEEKDALTAHKKKKTGFINRLGDLLRLGDRGKKAPAKEEEDGKVAASTQDETKADTKEAKPDQDETKADTKETKPDQDETKADTKEAKPDQDETKADTKEAKPDQDETEAGTKETKPNQDETKADAKEAKPDPDETKADTKEAKPTTDEETQAEATAEPAGDSETGTVHPVNKQAVTDNSNQEKNAKQHEENKT